MMKLARFIKNLNTIIPITTILVPFKKFFLFLAYFTEMTSWIRKNHPKLIIPGTLKLSRDYQLRYELYQKVSEYYQLGVQKLTYLEFGVATGKSFQWWLENNKNGESLFFGFDTFEGLPEDWGSWHKKGDMSSAVPQIEDKRGQFFKGLFQDTLVEFIEKYQSKIKEAEKRIIHCDADLYSSTIFVLSQIYPFLKKGDIIFFDEFNVPLHEFKAFKEFTENFYVKLEPIAQVNTFYQIAFIVT